MAARKVRIGFCGVGSMGQCAHLRHYSILPDCEVAAISDPRARTARKVAERYGVPKVYPDAAAMLRGEELDGIVASQPFNRHGVLVPQLLESGRPLFIEKPLAGTLEAADRILEAIEGSGTWIMVGYNKRSDPASVFARERICELRASGEIGTMTYVRITMPPGDWIQGGFDGLIDEGDERPRLKTDPPAADMDEDTFEAFTSFVNYYIHQVNLVRYLIGEPYEFTWAAPSGVVLAGASRSGVPCVIEMCPYSTTVDWQESALVAFEHGYVKLDLPAPLACNRPGEVEVLIDFPDATPRVIRPHLPPVCSMKQQAANFVAAVRGDREPTCTAAEAYDDLLLARDYMRLRSS